MDKNTSISYKILIRAEQDRFKDDVIRLYELIGGTEVYNKLMEIAGVTKEAVEARRSCDVSYAQENGLSEKDASGALTGAFVLSSDYLKGTKEYKSIMQLINSFEEESEDEEIEM